MSDLNKVVVVQLCTLSTASDFIVYLLLSMSLSIKVIYIFLLLLIFGQRSLCQQTDINSAINYILYCVTLNVFLPLDPCGWGHVL